MLGWQFEKSSCNTTERFSFIQMGLTLMSQKIQFFIHFFVYGVHALNSILPHYLLERRSSSWVFVESETFQVEVEMASNQNHFELYMFWSSFDSQEVRLLFLFKNNLELS